MMTYKGSMWLSNLKSFQEMFSPADIEKVKQAISETDRKELFGKKIVEISQVEAGAAIRFCIAADKVLGQGDMNLWKKICCKSAQKDFSGIYKLFISLTSPNTILKNAGRVWKLAYSQGEAYIENLTEHSGDLKIINAPDIPSNHDIGNAAACEEMLRMSGCKNVRSQNLKCIARGDPECLIRFFWD